MLIEAGRQFGASRSQFHIAIPVKSRVGNVVQHPPQILGQLHPFHLVKSNQLPSDVAQITRALGPVSFAGLHQGLLQSITQILACPDITGSQPECPGDAAHCVQWIL